MNIVLLVIDSLRADHLSCYGYPRATTPFLDSLAARGGRFENFFTPATPTQPAITTLFTGQHPITHRIFAQSGRNRLAKEAPWFPEMLAADGYATVAIDNLALGKKWFRRGFQFYRSLADLRTGEARYLRCTDLNKEAAHWLDAHGRQPFFMYLRYGDPHTPYSAPEPYRDLFYKGDPTVTNRGSLDEFYHRPLKSYLLEDWLNPAARRWEGAEGARIEDVEWCRAQYDAEIRFADDGVAEFVSHLEKRGLAENTAVFVVGDHGESLGEHGIYFEHHGLYDCTIRPPLIVDWPGANRTGRSVAAWTQLPDLAPTVLEIAGLPVPASMDGESLVPLLTGRTTEHVYREIICCESTWMCKWAYLKDDYKLIIAREPDMYGNPPLELYNRRADPEELTNLAGQQPSITSDMKARFDGWLSSQLARTGEIADPLTKHGSVRDELFRQPSVTKKIRRRIRNSVRKMFHRDDVSSHSD
jgi:arylsulfatase A-like enzyme